MATVVAGWDWAEIDPAESFLQPMKPEYPAGKRGLVFSRIPGGHRMSRGVFGLAILAIGLLSGTAAHAQFGPILNGVGPVNKSMAGASTAAPLDTLGAFMWNPATISALPNSTDFGLEVLMPYSKLSSSVANGAFAGGTSSQPGAFPLPEFGVVYRPDDSAVTYGVGVLAVAGFGVNYPGDPSNPLLSAPPPKGIGVGPVFSQYSLLQLVPTVAYDVNDQLTLGFSPIVDIASVNLDPGFVTSPDATGGAFPSYPPMTHGSYQWGAGFQLGVWYKTDGDWNFGASYKSQQWFNPFTYNSRNQIGEPVSARFLLNAPMITSVGTSYNGFENWLLALDLRYLDFANTPPFSGSGFSSTGAVQGLAFNNVFALATGAQYTLSDQASLRMGYSYSTNPIANSNAYFNVASPVIIQHGLTLGGSYRITDSFNVSLAYGHFFGNSVTGPLLSPAGPIPGTSLTSEASADSVTIGTSVLF